MVIYSNKLVLARGGATDNIHSFRIFLPDGIPLGTPSTPWSLWVMIVSECDEYIQIFRYSNILVTNIYSDIRSDQFFVYKYIQTFVCTNIFRHPCVSVQKLNEGYIRIFIQISIQIFLRTFVRVKFYVKMYSDIHLCKFVDTNIFKYSSVWKFSRMSHFGLFESVFFPHVGLLSEHICNLSYFESEWNVGISPWQKFFGPARWIYDRRRNNTGFVVSCTAPSLFAQS